MEKRIDQDKLDDPKPAGSMLIVEKTPGPP
jgi:hypothetical protein